MSQLDKRLQKALSESRNVELAVLFGSNARGDERAGSDVDVAIRLVDDSPEERRQVEVVLQRAAGREVDVVPLDASPPLLRFEIAREGKVLIERNPHAWADFRARAMLDWWDWAPTARMIHATSIARLRESVRRGPS